MRLIVWVGCVWLAVAGCDLPVGPEIDVAADGEEQSADTGGDRGNPADVDSTPGSVAGSSGAQQESADTGQSPVEESPVDGAASGNGQTDPHSTTAETVEPELAFERPPSVRPNPNPNAPLAAWVEFESNRPAQAALSVSDGDRRWQIEFGKSGEKKRSLLLLGLRPGRTHEIRVELSDAADGEKIVGEPLEFHTPPLPEDFPPIRLDISDPAAMEPGVTLFGVNQWLSDQANLQYGYLIGVDDAGEVVWYFRTGHPVADLRRMSNGHLLYNHGSNWHAYESDVLGNVVRHWYAANLVDDAPSAAIPVEVDTFHHEILELPSGNLLALSTELTRLEHYPLSEVKPTTATGPANVVGDVLVEFTPDGTVVQRTRIMDLLDTRRIGYGSLTGFWDTRAYQNVPGGTKDWSHANGLFYDGKDNCVIVSLRHQDAVVKFSRATGEIRWILGNHYDWRRKWRPYLLKAEGELEWPYHQHAPQLTPAGTLLLFDNGNYRAKPYHRRTPASENYSRVVEFRIDEDAMTVSQEWEYRGEPGETFYCPFFCEADWLPRTGNILITDGGHVDHANGQPSDDVPADHQWARILEVTHTRPARKVFELRIDSGPDSEKGFSVYRSQRLESLYHR